ncbi:MAG: homoaconitase [Planctomycetes bacterium]|nr:homoaconitase [Planctomycetota bacterium]
MPQTLIEQIAQAHAEGLPAGRVVRSGDVLRVRPAHLMTHDNTGAVIPKFRALGAQRVADPRQVVITLDHDVQNRGAANLAKYAAIEAFAREQGVDFHPAGRGIGHQVLCEEGYVLPGSMVVASDSHSNLYGGLGALGTPVVRSDAAGIWATGETWYRVPPLTRVVLEGELRDGATGKDVILALCGHFAADEVLGHGVEFNGPGVASLSVDERLTIANMTTEWGALAGVFPCDVRLLDWLTDRSQRLERAGRPTHGLTRAKLLELRSDPPRAQTGAEYAQTIRLNLAAVRPSVAGPDAVKAWRPLDDFEREHVPVHKAYLLSCVNGRADDLSAAARILDGRRVADGVQLFVAAASSEVEAELRARGDWQRLADAGARFLPAGCGPCIGLGEGLLEPGEVGISATNRNFKGRMGDRSASCYLASPQVVASSALAGRISGRALPAAGELARLERHTPAPREAALDLHPGFPRTLGGPLVFLDVDDLNTDGIYSKDWTYRDDLGPAEEASHAMENHDPRFRSIARPGDVLVAGSNFGSGSSREQAATCLKHFGIALVIAASFSETYKRNAFNNGFCCLESPQLVAWLREQFPDAPPTLRTGETVEVDVARSRLRVAEREFDVEPLGAVAQELVAVGGLAELVRRRLERC